MKKKVVLILSLILIISTMMFIAGCDNIDNNNVDNTPIVNVPVFEDITVNITDVPTELSLGTYTLKKVYVDGVEYAAENYSVQNKKLTFLFENYGEIGVGEYTIKLEFDEGDLTFVLTVTDTTTPDYTYDLAQSIVFGKNETVQFPTVVRNDDQQQYDCKYIVVNSSNVEVFNQDNITSESFTLSELAYDDYNLTVQIVKDEVTVEEFECDFSVINNDNYAVQQSLDDSLFDYTAFMTVVYDSEYRAIKSTKGFEATGVAARLAFLNSVIANKVADGYNTLKFKYLVESSEANTSTFAINSYTTADDFETSEIAKVYIPEFAPATDVWLEKEIYIADNTQADYFAFILNNDLNSSIYLKDIYFDTVDLNNLITLRNIDLWEYSTDETIAFTYNEDNSCFEILRKTDNSNLNSINDNIYLSLDWLKAWQDAEEVAFSFSVKGNNTFVSSAANSIKLFASASVTDSLTGEYETIAIDTADEFKTIVIDLDQFIDANEDANYLVISFGGATGSLISIKDFIVADQTALNNYITAKYENANYADSIDNWSSLVPERLTMTFDDTENAIKVTLNSDLPEVNLTSSYNKIYFSTADIYKAYNEYNKGYMKFSYKVNDTYMSIGKFRIYNNMTQATNGIYSTYEVESANVWLTGYISLESFFALPVTESVMAFTFCGNTNSTILFKDFVFATEQEYINSELEKDIFGSANSSNWKVTSANLATTYDATEEAVRFAPNNINGLNGRYFVTYYDTFILKAAQAAGYKAWSFNVKVNETFANNPVSGSFVAGVRLFGKVNSGLDGVAIADGSAGIYVYHDIVDNEISSEQYIQVVVDLDDLFSRGNDINYFGMVISGVNGSYAWFKDGSYMTDSEYNTYLQEQASIVIDSKNYAQSTAGWTNKLTNYKTMTYDEENSAIKVTFTTSRPLGGMGSNDNEIYMSTTDIYNTYTTYKDYGAKFLKFSYKASADYLSVGCFKLLGKDIVTDYNSLYKTYYVETADQWITEYISLEAFFGMTGGSSVLNFCLSGPADSIIMFKDIKFATLNDYAAYMQTKDIFTSNEINYQGAAYATNWQVTSTNIAKSYDATEDALKVVTNIATVINGRHFVAYYSANIIKEAYAAGFTELSFKVKCNSTLVNTENGGLRIFGKVAYGLDTVGIQDASAGIYEYQDVTEFTADTYQTVTIDIADFLAMDDDTNDIMYLGIVVAGNQGSTVYFKDFTLA